MPRIVFIVTIALCLYSGNIYAQEDGSEKHQLLNKIEELERRINEITEETRARKKLKITEEEKQVKEREVLEAVSRDYTLSPKYTLDLDYTFGYSYSPSEILTTLEEQVDLAREADHTIRHSVSTSYSVLDNLAVKMGLPFVYRYNKLGTEEELDEQDLGDISLGLGYQPYASKAGEIRTTLSFSASLPTGRSPYEINNEKELSTGDGTYKFSIIGSFSKQMDPVVAFWSLGCSYGLPVSGLDRRINDTVVLEKVEPGPSISFGAGLGYAMSYKVSVNGSFSYSYTLGSTYSYRDNPDTAKSADSTSASISVGVGWRVSDKTTLSFGLGYGLTGSGFSLTFRVPFSFVS